MGIFLVVGLLHQRFCAVDSVFPQKLQQLTRVPISPTTLPAQKTREPFHLDDLIIEKDASSGFPGTCKAHHHPPAQVGLVRLPPALFSGVHRRLLLLDLSSHPPLRCQGTELTPPVGATQQKGSYGLYNATCFTPVARSLTAHTTLSLDFTHPFVSTSRGRGPGTTSLSSELHLTGPPTDLLSGRRELGFYKEYSLLCHKEEDIKGGIKSQITGVGRKIIST